MRAIFSGFLVWLSISISFFILENIKLTKDSFETQSAIVLLLTVFFASAAAKLYYQNTIKTNGLKLGFIMSGTALLLDIVITVPFVEIPNGRSYKSFFFSPVLWLLVLTTIFSVYFYWRKNRRAN